MSGEEEQVPLGGRRSWRVSLMEIAMMSTMRGDGRLRDHILSWSSGGRSRNCGNDGKDGLGPWACRDVDGAMTCEVIALRR